MQQTLHASPEIQYIIPIGRRIREIMDEKGRSCSFRALAMRTGMSKDVLFDITTEERPTNSGELNRIAKGLGVEVARMKQADTREMSEELERLLQSMKNPKRALELAKWLHEKAIGRSERCDSFNNLGRAYFFLGRYEESHEAFTEAYHLAKSISDKYGETARLYKVVKNLLLTSTVSKDYYKITKLLNEVEKNYVGSSDHLGDLCYARAVVSEKIGDLEETRKNYYQSLEFFRLSNHSVNIAKAEHNVASFEFRMGNYKESENLFAAALEKLREYQFEKLVCMKEYCKTLIKLGRTEQAEQMIQGALSGLQVYDDPVLTVKFHLLLARATNNTQLAEEIANNVHVKANLRQIACIFLINHYERIGEYDKLSKVYQVAKILSTTKMDILMEEEL